MFPVLDATSPSLNNDVISSADFSHKSFTINYAKRLIDLPLDGIGSSSDVNKWRVHSITLLNNDPMIVKEWFETLTRTLNGNARSIA